MSLTKAQVKKILKQVQNGLTVPILELKASNPNFHWSTLKYPDTGDTALHCAARLGHLPLLKYLFTFTPSGVDCKNNDDKTALHESAQFSQLGAVLVLLENGAQVNALKRADWTPLMLACTKDNLEVVQVLIDKGAIINYRNKDGWTSLHLAIREGNLNIVRLLIEKGGDLGLVTKNGRTVLHIAALHGHLKIVNFLLELDNTDIDVCDNCGNTPLHDALLSQNLDILKLLIQNGAEIYRKNNADFNLLLLASSVGYTDILNFLVNELEFDVNETNSNGFSALHCAARKAHFDTCKALINLGCKEDIRDNFGRTANEYLVYK